MSTALFKSVFRASLAYPSENCDFAFYVLESRELIPGLDLFSDRFRCDPQTLLAALKWNIQELISAKHYMKVGIIQILDNRHLSFSRHFPY